MLLILFLILVKYPDFSDVLVSRSSTRQWRIIMEPAAHSARVSKLFSELPAPRSPGFL